ETIAPPTASQAFRRFRSSLEEQGVLVLLFPIGPESVQGFSVWDDRAPAIAVNTAANHPARIFTLFHEYGHLLTRTSSMCLDAVGTRLAEPTDPAERWCER